MSPPRLRLRPVTRRDVPLLTRAAEDAAVGQHLAIFRTPVDAAGQADFVETMRTSGVDRLWRAETLRGRAVGWVGLHDIDWVDRCAEVGVMVARPTDWGRGYAAAAVHLLMGLAFERLNLNRLEARVVADHMVARAMYEHLGFFPEATLRQRRFLEGQYRDVVVLSRLAVD